jgi:DNA-binding MarR family transcriptional regulator
MTAGAVGDAGATPPKLARALRDFLIAGEHLRRSVAARLGVDVEQFIALSHLFHNGDYTAAELGQELGLSPDSSVALAGQLIDVGLICATEHPAEGSGHLLILTEAGERALRAAYAPFEEAVGAAVAQHPDLDLDITLAMVNAAVRNLGTRAQAV